MEKKKYVTFDKRLISNLEVFGFKRKNQNVFLRMQNEALQTIRIVHSTHGERFVKHYCVSLHVEYPKVNKVLTQLNYNDNIYDGFGINIGYLYKNGSFKEFRIADTDDDKTVFSVIENIVSDIRGYALHYFEKYSTIKAAIVGMETGEITCTALRPMYSLPIYYLATDLSEASLIYVNNCEEKIRKGYEKQVKDYEELRKLHDNRCVNMPNDYDYRNYPIFAKRIRDYIRIRPGDSLV